MALMTPDPSCATDPTDETDAGLTAFAYIYNVGLQVVPVDGDIFFSNHGVIIGNFTHELGTAPIILGTAGTYSIWFNGKIFTLFQNGLAVAGEISCSVAGPQVNPCKVIITVHAGDVLTVKNNTIGTAVTIESSEDGLVDSANASILIEKTR